VSPSDWVCLYGPGSRRKIIGELVSRNASYRHECRGSGRAQSGPCRRFPRPSPRQGRGFCKELWFRGIRRPRHNARGVTLHRETFTGMRGSGRGGPGFGASVSGPARAWTLRPAAPSASLVAVACAMPVYIEAADLPVAAGSLAFGWFPSWPDRIHSKRRRVVARCVGLFRIDANFRPTWPGSTEGPECRWVRSPRRRGRWVPSAEGRRPVRPLVPPGAVRTAARTEGEAKMNEGSTGEICFDRLATMNGPQP
jgi:hypothetical protein